VLFFKDPYSNIDFDNSYSTGNTGNTGSTSSTSYPIIPDEVYKFKVFELCRYANAEFNSTYLNFGQLKNFFYHKVNPEDPSTILELSNDGAFLSLYPLINEVGIDYKDFYVFSSNWEPGYFTKSIDKSKIQSVIGTRSMTEKKSFFGSKYLKVPEQITLETFVPSQFFRDAIQDPALIDGTFMYEEDQANINCELGLENANQELFKEAEIHFKRAAKLYEFLKINTNNIKSSGLTDSQNYENKQDKYASNLEIQEEADGLLDFSESNPFGNP